MSVLIIIDCFFFVVVESFIDELFVEWVGDVCVEDCVDDCCVEFCIVVFD